MLVHAVIVLPFVLDLSLPTKKLPDRNGAGASLLRNAAAEEMSVVFIDEPSPPLDTPPPKLEALNSRGLASLDRPVVVLSPDASSAAVVAPADMQEATDLATASDTAQHALLYGRYLGELQARIERAWLRPRTEIGAARFSCQVRIKQDRHGAVVDVRFDHCNGTLRWQQSLLTAIRTASPLPAPPDGSVYADVLWLSFASDAFELGGSTQGFEPELPQVASANDRALESFKQFVNGSGGNRKQGDEDPSKVYRLTIIGTPAGASVPAELPHNGAVELRPADPRSPEPLPQ